MICDPSCQTCSGGGANQCLTCPSGKYFYAENNSCLSCNVDGFYISGYDCLACDPSCKSCSGPAATDCLSCFPDDTLTSQNTCTISSSVTAEIAEKASEAASASSQTNEATTSILPLLANGASTTVILLAEFAGDALFYRFINVKFPQNFMDFCVTLEEDLFPNPYENLDCFQSELGKFQEFELSTCFLENSGHLLNKEAFAIVLIALSWILSWLLKSHKRLAKPIIYVRTVLTWNTMINYALEDFKELILVAILDLYERPSERRRLSEHVSSVGSRFSYVIAVIIIVAYIAMFAFFGYLLNRKVKRNLSSNITSQTRGIDGDLQGQSEQSGSQNQEKGEVPEPEKWMKVPQAFESISSELKNDSWFSRNFILILELSGFLSVLVFLFLQDHGIVQAVLYLVINLILLILVVFIYKPFELKLQTRLFAMNFLSRIVMAVLAIFIGARPDQFSNEQFGLVLIILTVATILINSSISVWLLIKMIVTYCKAKIKARRLAKAKKIKTHPLSPINDVFISDIDTPQKSPSIINNEPAKFSSQLSLIGDKDLAYSIKIDSPKSKIEVSEHEGDRSFSEKVKLRVDDSYSTSKLGLVLRKSNSPRFSKINLDTLGDSPLSITSTFRFTSNKRARFSQTVDFESKSQLHESKEIDKKSDVLHESREIQKKSDIIEELSMIVEDPDRLKAGSENKL